MRSMTEPSRKPMAGPNTDTANRMAANDKANVRQQILTGWQKCSHGIIV